jgi:hypothetical protein
MHAVAVDGEAVAQFSVMDYGRSTVGPYHEAAITILASLEENVQGGILFLLKFLRMMPGSAPKTQGYFIAKLWVDTGLAKMSGNELFGFNKDLAAIHLCVPGGSGCGGMHQEALGMEVSTEAGQWIARARLAQMPGHLDRVGLNVDYYAISPGNDVHPSTWVRNLSRNRAPTRRANFVPGKDVFEWNEVNPWGRLLKTLNFAPKSVSYTPNYELQLFSGRDLGVAR